MVLFVLMQDILMYLVQYEVMIYVVLMLYGQWVNITHAVNIYWHILHFLPITPFFVDVHIVLKHTHNQPKIKQIKPNQIGQAQNQSTGPHTEKFWSVKKSGLNRWSTIQKCRTRDNAACNVNIKIITNHS